MGIISRKLRISGTHNFIGFNDNGFFLLNREADGTTIM